MSDVITWRIDPPKEFEEDAPSKFVAAWQSAMLNQPDLRDVWADTIYQLLSAPAYGYSAVEIFWEWRTIVFRVDGQEYRVLSWVPVGMEFIHQKSFRFDLDTDAAGLYSADGGMNSLKWAMGKILFHRCLGDGITERRGFMTAAIWNQYGIQQGWQDLLIYMHLYGIPQIGVKIEKEILDQAEERQILDEAVSNWGEGEVPIILNEMSFEKLGQVESTGDTIHPKVIKMAEEDLSVLITGSILAQTQGTGTGSYGATDQHAITAHAYRIPDGTKLASDVSSGLLRPALYFNTDALCRVGGFLPEQLQGRSGVFGWKANGPAATVSDVLAEARALSEMNFPLSARELSQKTGWGIADGDDVVPGKTVVIPAGDAAMGGGLAAPGVEGPPKIVQRVTGGAEVIGDGVNS
jgi:phage gp29-like protein